MIVADESGRERLAAKAAAVDFEQIKISSVNELGKGVLAADLRQVAAPVEIC